MNDYTVVGFWEDNGDGYVDHTTANNAQDACNRIKEQEDTSDSSFVIVAGFDGIHHDRLI